MAAIIAYVDITFLDCLIYLTTFKFCNFCESFANLINTLLVLKITSSSA